MIENTGLVLEGGGTRGVFTAGVLDFFLDKQLDFPYVIGVSAGAGNATNYVAKQRGRIKASMIDYLREDSYAGWKTLFEKGSLFDFELIYDKFPNELFPFDYDAFFSSKQTCLLTTTNCHTGQAMFLEEEHGDKKRLMKLCRASCSVPVISPMVEVDGIPMLDGGIGDSIPIKKAMKDGYEKNVLILTRNKFYRKEASKKENILARVTYNDYPWFLRSVLNRPSRYNRNLKRIEKMEKEGKIFVIRPTEPVIKETERDPDVLEQFYEHGYQIGQQTYSELLNYLES